MFQQNGVFPSPDRKGGDTRRHACDRSLTVAARFWTVAHRFSGGEPTKRAACCASVLICLICAPTRAQRNAPKVIGGHGIIWAMRDMSDDESTQRWRFTHRKPGPADTAFWRFAARGSEVGGDPRLTAVQGKDLHVWFADGTHRYYGTRRSGVGRALPESAVPLDAAGSDPASPMYAIVEQSVALALEQVPADEGDTPSADEETAEPLPAPDEPRWQDSRYVVVRLEKGRWQGDRGLPLTWFESPSEVHLLASAASLTIVFRPDESRSDFVFTRSEDADSIWTEPLPIEGLHPDDLLAAAMSNGDPILVVARNGGSRVTTLRLDNTRWVEGAPLAIGHAAIPLSRIAFGTLGSDVVGVWVSDDGTVRSALWSIQGGGTTGETPVRPLTPGPSAQSWRTKQFIIAYMTLALVLVVVFFRRRISVIETVKLPSNVRLASHSRRLMAFGIDALLFAPAAMYVYRPLLQKFEFDEAMIRQATMIDADVMQELVLRWIAVAGAFVLYAIIFEAWWRATPGKRLLHMRVLDETGHTCGLTRILVRNVLRAVEFFPGLDLLPTLVLIFLTRNRQRIGDLIGGTIVVEELPAAPQPPEQPEDSAEP